MHNVQNTEPLQHETENSQILFFLLLWLHTVDKASNL